MVKKNNMVKNLNGERKLNDNIVRRQYGKKHNKKKENK